MSKKEPHTETKHSSGSATSFMHGAVLGALFGFVLSELFLHPQGKQRREKIKKTTDKTIDKTREMYDIVQADLLPALEEIKPEAKKVLNQAMEKEKVVAEKITHLADFTMEEIDKKKKKSNKLFKGSF